MSEATSHHPWCNFFFGPRAGCKLCARLFEEYPLEEGDSDSDLVWRHFPGVAESNGLPAPGRAARGNGSIDPMPE